jgi:hypothetical protein
MTGQTIDQTINPATGQMTWRLPGQAEPLLHLRSHPLEPWKPYTECPTYMKPDPPYVSAGYATFINLLKLNWEVVK